MCPEISGSVNLPPLPASRAVDLPASDDADSAFSAQHWSSVLPRGYALCQRRAASPYDADLLEYFEALAQLEEEYAKGLQKLSERLTREPDAAVAGGSEHRGGLLGGWSSRPLARSLQYASVQRGWSAVQQAVRAQAQAHRGLSEEVRATVVKPLQSAVKEARAREHGHALSGPARDFEAVKTARLAARDEAERYGKLLHRYRKEARKRSDGRTNDRGPEAMLLCAAAHDCATRVADANVATRRFENDVAPAAIDALQEHEERRLEAVDSALNAFATLASSTGAVPADAAASLRTAAERVDVPSDVCGFAATYAASASRVADELVPPSFCSELAEAADTTEHAQAFWAAPWRLLKNIAASVFGDDGKDEPQLLTASQMEQAAATPAAPTATTMARTPYHHPAGPHAAHHVPSNLSDLDDVSSPAYARVEELVSPDEAGGATEVGVFSPIGFDPSKSLGRPASFDRLRNRKPIGAAAQTVGGAGGGGANDSVGVVASPPGQLDVTSPDVVPAPRPSIDGASSHLAKGATAADSSTAAGATGVFSPSCQQVATSSAPEQADAILFSVDELVMGMGGGKGLTAGEARLLQEQVLAATAGQDAEDAESELSCESEEEGDDDEDVEFHSTRESPGEASKVLSTGNASEGVEGGNKASKRRSMLPSATTSPPVGYAEGEWYFVDSAGKTEGPVTWAELKQFGSGGADAPLQPESWTFMEGMSEWLSADMVPGLLTTQPANQPPPPPGAEKDPEVEEFGNAEPSRPSPPPPPPDSPPADATDAEEAVRIVVDAAPGRRLHSRASLLPTLSVMAIPEDTELNSYEEGGDGENVSPHRKHSKGPAASKARKAKPAPVRDSFACFPNEAIYDDSLREDEEPPAPPPPPPLDDLPPPPDYPPPPDDDALPPPPPPPLPDTNADGTADALFMSPTVSGRTSRRTKSMARRSSVSAGGAGGKLRRSSLCVINPVASDSSPTTAAGEQAFASPPTLAAQTSVGAFRSGGGATASAAAATSGTVAGGSGGGGVDSSLLGAIQGFDKVASLRKVRRQSRAFAARGSAVPRYSLGGGKGRRSIGPPPPPPPNGSGAEALATDIASVLAREIMRRRQHSRLDEEELAASAREESRETSARSDEDAEGNWVTSPSENPSPPSRTTSLSKTPSFTHTFTRFERANSAFI